MSDMGLPFDGTPAADGGGQRKKVVLLAAVAVLVLLLAVLVVPKLLASDVAPVAKPTATGRATTQKAPAKKKAKAKPVAKKPKPFNGALAKDPFKAVYLPPEEREKAPVAPTAAPTPGTGTPTGKTLTLVDVKGEGNSVTVSVLTGGKNYDGLKIGQSFADGQFKVVSANGKCASFLYGDQQFALCEGEKAFEYV
jgi:hypothetical protein